MKPTIGRIVIFTLPEAHTPVNGTREHPAVVTRVHGDGETPLVNVQVLFDAAPIAAWMSVPHVDTPERNTSYGSWRWPDRAA